MPRRPRDDARPPGSLVHAATGTAIATLHLVGGHRLALAGAAWYTVVATSAAPSWWLPYLFDVQRGEVDDATFAAEYAGNLTVLPRIGDHPVTPDVQHLLIHGAVAVSATPAWTSFARGRARGPVHRERAGLSSA